MADNPATFPWFVIVNPDWYDEDEGDAGYAWSGEASDKTDAVNQALAACWSDNDREDDDGQPEAPPTYDPDAPGIFGQPDGFTIYAADIDFRELAADVIRARRSYFGMRPLTAALNRLDAAFRASGRDA